MPTKEMDWPEPVRSLEELFALAHLLETEAVSRYTALAGRMRELGLGDVAAVFDGLVAEEEAHAAAVEEWSRAATGAAPDPAWVRWQPEDPFDEEEARAIASSRLATAYRALSMAVRNEERAFRIWAYIAARAEDAAVRAAAERLAKEELGHAAKLRRARRQAYHAARAAGRIGAPLPPAMAAHEVERVLARDLAALAGREGFAAHAAELRRLAAEADEMGSRTAAPAAPQAVPEAGEPGLAEVRRLAERAAELYLDAVDRVEDEEGLLRLQSLADRAIARIARLGAISAG